MRAVIVLPWIVRSIRDACVASCKLDLLEVDNSGTNLGIMRANNIGIDELRRVDGDWLVLLSAAVRFGEPGGLDYLRALELSPDHSVVHVAGLFGWHMIAFSRDTVEACGRFDENLSPYGYDDNDYAIRIHKAKPDAVWAGIIGLDITDHEVGMGHSLKLGGVHSDPVHLLRYFAAKWGIEPHGQDFPEFYDRPFDDPANPIGYWPPPTHFPPVDGARWDEPAPATEQATVWNP